jgi:endonuclease YncB( thermonuclease family)
VKYAHEQSAEARLNYSRAEEEARISRSGLWTVAAPTPPWDYRREQAARAEAR